MSKDVKKTNKLDDAVEKTFPASDPVNVGTPTGTEPSRKPVELPWSPVSGQPAKGQAAISARSPAVLPWLLGRSYLPPAHSSAHRARNMYRD